MRLFISKLSTMIFLMSNVTAFGQVSNAIIEEAVKDLGGKAVSASVEITQPQAVVPKYNNDQTGNGDLFGTGEIVPLDSGNAKITNCANTALDSNLYNRQECEGINFVSQNKSKRPNMTVTNNDPIVGTNRTIASNPVPVLDKYGFILPKNADGSIGSIPSNACKPTSVSIPAQYEERVCSDYKAGEQFLCKQTLIANVIPHFNYRCDDVFGRNSTEKCNKILKVDCPTAQGNCTQNVITNINADLPFSFSQEGTQFVLRANSGANAYPNPAIGRKGNEMGTIYKRTIEFDVKNNAQVSNFVLSSFSMWDTFLIKVNGKVAFKSWPVEDRIEYDYSRLDPKAGYYVSASPCIKVGPNKYLNARSEYPMGSPPTLRCGGDSYYADSMDPIDGMNTNTLGFKTYFANIPDSYVYRMPYSPNAELKDFLVTGHNKIEITIRTRTFRGQIDASFRTSAVCPSTCTEYWDNQCVTLESRSR